MGTGPMPAFGPGQPPRVLGTDPPPAFGPGQPPRAMDTGPMPAFDPGQPPRTLGTGPPPAFCSGQPPRALATGPPAFGSGQSPRALATGPPPAFGSGQPGTSHAYGGGAQMPSTHPNLGMPSSPNHKQLQRAYSNPPFSPTAPVPPAMQISHPPTMNRTMSTEPATHQADFQPSIARVPSLDPKQASVKVTRLPPTITKEKLHLHFRKAGEIKGEPVIHITNKSVYAHVNFNEPISAQNAVSMLDNSDIDNLKIRVKLAPTKSNVEMNSIEYDNYEKILKVGMNQWNTLMLVDPVSKTSPFQDAIAPYKSNPNVIIHLAYENQSVKFSGKYDAVEDAYSTLKRQLTKELPVDRLKIEDSPMTGDGSGVNGPDPVLPSGPDYQSYLSRLPVDAHPHLERQLDWGHEGVDRDLNEIANHSLDWEEKLSVPLGLTATDISDIKTMHQNKPQLQRREVLRRWKEKQGLAATYGNLLEVCVKAGHTQSAEAIYEVLKKKYVGSMSNTSKTSLSTSEASTSSHTHCTPSIDDRGHMRGPQSAPQSSTLPHLTAPTNSQEERPSLKDLCKELKVICEEWRDMGLFLDLQKEELEEVESHHGPSPFQCMKTMFKVWLSREQPPPTWATIREALEDLGHEQLVLTLRQNQH